MNARHIIAVLLLACLAGCGKRTESGQCMVIVWTVPPVWAPAPCTDEGAKK